MDRSARLFLLLTFGCVSGLGCLACGAAEARPTTNEAGELTEVPGLRFRFAQPSRQIRLSDAAAGVSLPYEIVISGPIEHILFDGQVSGGCGSPGPAGFEVLEEVRGRGQRYAEVEGGLCPHDPPAERTLQPGTFQSALRWNGRNWLGASDTGMPYGEPFPPGDYEFAVSASGALRLDGRLRRFRVEAAQRIELLP